MWQGLVAAGMGGNRNHDPVTHIVGHQARQAEEKFYSDQKNVEYERQKEFAQHGVRWRVQDAIAAGINPLAALGFSGSGYSPQASVYAGSAWDDMKKSGQDVSRMLQATRTMDEREQAFADLKLENASLQNDMLRSQIAKLNSGQVGPAFPNVNDKPMERTGMDRSNPSREVGASPDTGWVYTRTGVAPVPSKDTKERIEDNLIQEAMWSYRNNLIPTMTGKGTKPPSSMLPKGADDWQYSRVHQEWRPVKNDGYREWDSIKKWLNKPWFR